MSKIRKSALINSLATTVYVILVGLFMYFGSEAKIGRVNPILGPIAVLMLFVFSAALTGYLIFGKPIQLYIDGKKKEAVSLLSNTLVFFFVVTFISLLLLFIFAR